jgi:hypothetical protein
MSDVIAESLILVALLAAFLAWRRLLAGRPPAPAWAAAVVAGIAGGLAALTKLNGALAMLVVIAWAILALGLPRFGSKARGFVGLATLVAGLVSLLTFTAGNPFLTAHPRGALTPEASVLDRMPLGERMVYLARFRMSVSQDQQVRFPVEALYLPSEKLATVVVQGFGRFGPMGPSESMSWVRYDAGQDWGSTLWLATVLAGLACVAVAGHRQLSAGEPPGGWALIVYWLVALTVVTAYLPLAWDRYYLSIQAPSALLGSSALTSAARLLLGRIRAPRAGELDA